MCREPGAMLPGTDFLRSSGPRSSLGMHCSTKNLPEGIFNWRSGTAGGPLYCRDWRGQWSTYHFSLPLLLPRFRLAGMPPAIQRSTEKTRIGADGGSGTKGEQLAAPRKTACCNCSSCWKRRIGIGCFRRIPIMKLWECLIIVSGRRWM